MKILFTEDLRNKVKNIVKEMHDYMKRGITPKVKKNKGCKSCSLKEICIPKLLDNKSAEDYMKKNIKQAIEANNTKEAQ